MMQSIVIKILVIASVSLGVNLQAFADQPVHQKRVFAGDDPAMVSIPLPPSHRRQFYNICNQHRYFAQQTSKGILITVSGNHPTPGWTIHFLPLKQTGDQLVVQVRCEAPEGAVIQVITPFNEQQLIQGGDGVKTIKLVFHEINQVIPVIQSTK